MADFAGKTLNLKITADTSGVQKGAMDAQRAIGLFSAKVNELGKSLGTALPSANKLGAALSQKGAWGESIGAIGKFSAEVQKASRPMDGFTAGITKLAIKMGLLSGAIGIAKDYFGDLFERAKTDPALAAVAKLHATTDAWMLSLRKGVDVFVVGFLTGLDRVADRLGQIAFGVTGNTETRQGSISVNATENARRKWDASGRKFIESDRWGHAGTAGTQEYQQMLQQERAAAAKWYDAHAAAKAGETAPDQLAIARGNAISRQTTPQSTRSSRGGGYSSSFIEGVQPLRSLEDIFAVPSQSDGSSGGFFESLGGRASQIGRGVAFQAQLMGSGLQRFAGGASTENAGMKFLEGGASGAAKQMEKLKSLTETLQGALSSTAEAVSGTIGATIAAGEAGARAAFRQGAAQLKTIAIVEGVQALAMGALIGVLGPAAAASATAHGVAAAAAVAGMTVLGALGGGIGGGSSAASGGSGAGYRGSSAIVPTNAGTGGTQHVTINISGVIGSPAKVAEQITAGMDKARAAGVGSVRNYTTTQFE